MIATLTYSWFSLSWHLALLALLASLVVCILRRPVIALLTSSRAHSSWQSQRSPGPSQEPGHRVVCQFPGVCPYQERLEVRDRKTHVKDNGR